MNLKRIYYKPIIWWSCQAGLIMFAGFFLVFGIQLCIEAYRLENPYFFILTFFSSNLIILISGVILIGLLLRIISVYRFMRPKTNKKENNRD